MCKESSTELILAIVGVAGTLFGVILGWLIQTLSTNRGKHIIRMKEYQFRYLSQSGSIYIMDVEIKFTVQNNKGVNIVLSDVALIFKHEQHTEEVPFLSLSTDINDYIPSLNDINVPANSVVSVGHEHFEIKENVAFHSKVYLRYNIGKKTKEHLLIILPDKGTEANGATMSFPPRENAAPFILV